MGFDDVEVHFLLCFFVSIVLFDYSLVSALLNVEEIL